MEVLTARTVNSGNVVNIRMILIIMLFKREGVLQLRSTGQKENRSYTESGLMKMFCKNKLFKYVILFLLSQVWNIFVMLMQLLQDN